MQLKTRKVNLITDSDWDSLVKSVYDKPYCFQQQDGCKERGAFNFSVPCSTWDYENNEITDNDSDNDVMGVSFQAWLDGTPKPDCYRSGIWWQRNFYPDVSMLINDLHKKGYLEEGDYVIEIDW